MHSKPRLLLIVHCYNNKAGVEEHVKVLARGLREIYQVFLTYPENGELILLQPEAAPATFRADRVSLLAPYRASVTEESLKKIIQIADPDIIHVVHFVNWPLGLLDLALTSGRPVVASFHDYYAITPHYTMQGETDPKETTTSAYANRIFSKDISNYLTKRREILLSSIKRLSARIVPSVYLQRQLTAVFPNEFEIIEYGIEPFTVTRSARAGERLNFGYLGSLLPQKGWDSLVSAFEKIQLRFPDAALRVYGGYAPNVAVPHVEFFGPYEQSQIPAILADIDIGIIPSIFAETFSIVLSEMWQGGITAAVSDIGAMGDRVIDGVNGKKFRPGDVDSIAATLTWFLEHDEWKSWKIPQPPLANAMCEKYDAVYRMAMKKEG